MSARQERVAHEESIEVGGLWLMKQGEMILGPISGEQVVEKLNTGELTGETPVARPGERHFQKLAETEVFRLHVAKAEARARVEAQVRAERERAQKTRMVVGGALATVTLVLAVGAWQVARYLAVHADGDESDGITMEPPTITIAQARPDEEALLEYPSNGTKRPDKPPEATPKPADTSPKPADTAPKPTAVAKAERPAPAPKRTGTISEDPDGLATHAQFDQGAINKVVAQQQKTLHRCFKEEIERHPGFTARVPIEFTIGNDGRVVQLWVDHPQLKKGAMYDCLLSELKKWPFKPFQGERPSVGLSFNLGTKG